MSISYWVAKKLGVIIVLFYLVVMGTLVVSYYSETGTSKPEVLAAYYPPGRSYPRTTKNKVVREIFGLPPSDDDSNVSDRVDIISYTPNGAVIRVKGKTQEEVDTNKVVRYLVNPDTGELERYIAPLEEPLNTLLTLHLRFMKRVEDGVGGDAGGFKRLIVPKVVISVAYLGIVLVALLALRRVDRASSYKAGFSLIYASFIYWPVAVIVISFVGSNVVDVVRHFPDSLEFMHWHVVASWAAIFAWPLFVTALSALDIVRSLIRLDYNHALGHAAVLGAGIISIPLVTIGVLFAILVCVMYIGYRMARRVLLPEKVKKALAR